MDGAGTRIERMGEAPRIGILAVQGNFREHAAVLRRLGGAQPFGQDRIENLLRRQRLGQSVGDPLKPVCSVGRVGERLEREAGLGG